MLVGEEVWRLIDVRIGLLVYDQVRLLVHTLNHLICFKIAHILCNAICKGKLYALKNISYTKYV
jgi:hypothetical protein